MNMNRLMEMVVRQVVRQVVNKGVRAGMSQMSSKNGTVSQDKQAQRRMQQSAKMMRRMTR